MLMPSIFRENLFDDWFDFPDFRDLDRTERMTITTKWILICLALQKMKSRLN